MFKSLPLRETAVDYEGLVRLVLQTLEATQGTGGGATTTDTHKAPHRDAQQHANRPWAQGIGIDTYLRRFLQLSDADSLSYSNLVRLLHRDHLSEERHGELRRIVALWHADLIPPAREWYGMAVPSQRRRDAEIVDFVHDIRVFEVRQQSEYSPDVKRQPEPDSETDADEVEEEEMKPAAAAAVSKQQPPAAYKTPKTAAYLPIPTLEVPDIDGSHASSSYRAPPTVASLHSDDDDEFRP